ncbi:MAG TPA: DUF2490 domain-containing protein [Chitinophagaceae bacterium]|nr:DUF2490 domain-containing protein [Chitinophagaceae bacterium]
MRHTFFFIMLLYIQPIMAQMGSWNIVNAKLDLTQKWNLFGELQLRSLKYYNDFHYYEVKGGASYAISKGTSVSAGFGIFDTYSPGGNFKTPMVNDEWRTWIQVSLTQYEKRLKLEHRYRAEQRWTSNGFRNRFRYRINTALPLNNKKIEPGTYYLTASNELFFTNRAPYFERTRIFIGGGYEFSHLFTLQAGYLHQFDYRINDETGKDFFQISLLFELKWKNKSGEKVPGGMD